ncbi:ribosome recycling factor domain-containing protein [Triangularia verruculosa]|uniref:Ribosome recycling factor domain-containing protein n=1 Tax=Triangularia verruculosa TaxID=2587418 RepID=A0AAN6XC11_9PEZI|nr:ribosome recycling factor domain-containing protein [Triangularia verruculosa]
MNSLRVANSLVRTNATVAVLRTSSSVLLPLAQRASSPWLSQTPRQTLTVRPFSQSPNLSKRNRNKEEEVEEEDPRGKKGKKNNKKEKGSAPQEQESPGEDPFNLDPLIALFQKAESHYASQLALLRSPTGRFNVDSIGAIPVSLDKKSPVTYRLQELATVAPLGGRRWSILAFEEASVKPIISAVLKSPDFNQQPQRNEENPLELTMTVEPEKVDDLVKRAKDLCTEWRNKLRDETHKHETQVKKNKSLLKDDLFKIKEALKKLQDERMKVVANKEKEVVAAIQSKAGK